MGKDSEAAPYYETAIANSLIEDRSGATLGLDSTYCHPGEYEKSLLMDHLDIRLTLC